MPRTTAFRLQARDIAGSAFGFGAVLTALVMMDPRVSHKLGSTFYPSPTEKLISWGDRLADLGAAVLSAAQQQTIDNGPVLVLTVVGILLVGFMVRT